MKTLLVALLLFVVGTGTAFAECAWVLWVRSVPTDSNGVVIGSWTPWTPYGASTTATGCEELNPTSDEARKRILDQTGIKVATGQLAKLTWQCLPDTVDPRGPKGGGR